MTFESLIHNIQTAQRDAGEQAVIRHLEQQGLSPKPQQNIEPEQVAEGMYRAYSKAKHAQAMRDARASYDMSILIPPAEWHQLEPNMRTCWIASALEGIALVAAMNAFQPNRLSP